MSNRDWLITKLDGLARRLLAVISEAFYPAQLLLRLQLPELAVQPGPIPPAPTAVEKRRPTGRKLRTLRLPEQWRGIGQQVSEQLDYEPAGLLRRRIIRKNMFTAPMPE